MKAYSKSQLAQAAGVSLDTFRKWLITDKDFLDAHGVKTADKIFPPHVVRYLCNKYLIEIKE